MIRTEIETPELQFSACHDGIGTILCRSYLNAGDSAEGLVLFHSDILPPGTSIGEHPHTVGEEIYYLVEGECDLIEDGKRIPMKPGDFQIVGGGHSHGIVNTGSTNARLIVVGANKNA